MDAQGVLQMFQQGRQQAQGQQDQQMKGLMGLIQLQKMMQEQQREQEFRSGLSALGPNPTQEGLAGLAARYSKPADILRTQQSSLDRQATLDAAREGREATIGAARENKEAQIQATLTAARERIAAQVESARQRGADQRAIAEMQLAGRRDLMQLAASLRQPQQPRPVQLTTDEQGNQLGVNQDGTATPLRTPEGATIRKPPTPAALKIETAKRKTVTDLNEAIRELEKATADGGLIDKSTGSGAGALVDMAGNFVGYATPGARAVGQLQPIFDLALKMVPRFEGPQSDKDTQTYKEASGQLANPNVPNKTKKDAGRTLLRLMKQRRGQFVSKDIVGTEADIPPPVSPQGVSPQGGPKFLGFE